MAVELVDAQVLGTAVAVVGREARRGRADLVHHRDGEEGGCGGARGQQGGVDVGEGGEDGLAAVAVQPQVLGDLGVGRPGRDRRAAPDVAEEGDVGHDAGEARHEAGHREGDAPALADAGDDDLVRVHGRVRAGRLDEAHGVGEHPPVVVVVGAFDAAGEEAGDGAVQGGGVGGVAARGGPALAAGVHDEVRVTGVGPEHLLVRQTAAAAVAEELHHAAERTARAGGQVQPAADGLAGEAGHRDVVGHDLGQSGVHRREGGCAAGVPGLAEGLLPEGVEVGGLVEVGPQCQALGEGEVRQWHGGAPVGEACARRSAGEREGPAGRARAGERLLLDQQTSDVC